MEHQIRTDFGESSSFKMRKIFILFCIEAVGRLTTQHFFETFYSTYIALAADKVQVVRLDFARSLLHVRPFLDALQPVQTEIHQIIS